MKEQPLVSIIMPVHNSEEYIGLAIKSVQKQSYNNWELIIIDDYSKDNTRNIIIEYSKALLSSTKIRAWDIKFLGNVKKLISINYLIEISFFDMYFIMYSSLSCYFPYIKCH